MDTNTQITIGIIIIGALLSGILIGERRIMRMMRYARYKKRKRRQGYSSGWGGHSNYEYDDRGGYSGYILFIIAVVVVSAVLFFNFFGGKLPVKLDEYLNRLEERKETIEDVNLAEGPSSSSEPQNQDPVIVEIIDEAAEDRTTSTSEAAKTESYLVQVGVFSEWENADRQMQDIAARGFKVGYYVRENITGIKIYHIFTGVSASYEEAERMRQELGFLKGIIQEATGIDLQYKDP